MITIEIVGQTELSARLAALPGNVRRAVKRAVTILALEMEARVKGKLSGEVLNVRTGALRRSIHHEVIDTADAVYGVVFSTGGKGKNPPYAAIHEYGGKIDVPEIFPVKASALHFFMQGREIFARRVRAHSINMPERAYMRPTLAEFRDKIGLDIDTAVKEALK